MDREIQNRWILGEAIDGVLFHMGQRVRIASGKNAGVSGILISLYSLPPDDPLYHLETEDGLDLRVRQSELAPIPEVMGTAENKIVATGTWFYDQNVPMRISVHAKHARFASSRYNDDYLIDESRPIPETKDGFLYFCSLGKSGEHLTVDDAKAWADAQPWGPVKWD